LTETLPKKQQEQLSSSSPQRKSPPKKSKGIRLLDQTTKDSRKLISQKQNPILSSDPFVQKYRSKEDGKDKYADLDGFIVAGADY
jgi:hypothetical protein